MLKALLVDDDILVRVGLRMMIDWPMHGWEIAGEAGNGIQALEMVETLKPDLLIVDMKMPLVDGAELLKLLKQRNAKTKVAVLSCYDDYNYMKEAMTNGASAYMLKPELNKEMLVESLGRIERQIREEERRDKEYYDLKKQAVLNAYIAHEAIFRDLLRGKYVNGEEAAMAFIHQGIDVKEPYAGVAVFAPEDGGKLLQSYDAQKRDAIKLSLFNIIQGVLHTIPSSRLIRDDNSEDCIAIVHGYEAQSLQKKIAAAAEHAVRLAAVYTQIDLSVGIGAVSAEIWRLNVAYNQAREVLKRRFFFGGERVASYESLPSDDRNLRDCTKNMLEQYHELFTSLAVGDEEGSNRKLRNLLEYVRTNGSIRLLRAVCSELAGWYNKRLHLADIDGMLFGNPSYMSVEELLGCRTMEEIADLYACRCKTLSGFGMSVEFGTFSPAIRKAIEYMNAHYDRNIGLSDVSGHVGMSRNHLSLVFREQTGQNFVEYLTGIRIEQARRLLSMEEMKVYEVAAKVGFESEKYFSQVFRGRMGITPTEYRKQSFT